MKSTLKIFGIAILSLFTLILLAMLVIPSVYKEDIYKLVKKEAEQNVDAELELGDIEISFFKSFPKPAITLKNFKVSGTGPFEGIDLIQIGEAVAQINLWSLFNMDEGIVVNKIGLENTNLDIRIPKKGKPNYDIYISNSNTESYEKEEIESSALKLELKALKIKNVNLNYSDESSQMYADIKNLNTDGFVQIDGSNYAIKSTSSIDALNLIYGDISYLSNSKVNATINCLADLDQMKFTLNENSVKLNALELHADGSVQIKEESIISDISFEAPGNSFGELFSLVPSAYIEDYQDIDFDGSFSLNGFVKGAYYEDHYPAVKLNILADKGSVHYPDLPFPIKDIKAQLKLNKKEGDLDQLSLNIPAFSMNLQDQIFGGRFKLSRPLSNPSLDMALNGALDLKALSQAFPIEDIKDLTGILSAKLNFKGNYKQLETESYEDMSVGGSLSLQEFSTQAYNYPVLSIKALEADFSPEKVIIKDFSSKLGKSDISGNGQIENLLAYFYPEQTLKGAVTLRSNYFLADEWLEDSSDNVVENADQELIENNQTSDELTALPIEKFDFTLDAKFDQIDYESYTLENLRTKGHMTSNFLAAEEFSAEIEDSDFNSSGIFRNIFGFLLNDELLEGELNLTSNRLNLNPFMTTEETVNAEEQSAESDEPSSYELLLIPKNVNLNLNAKAEEIVYEKVVMRDFEGKLLVNNGQVILEECTTNALGGSMLISGAYDTFDPEDPGFNFKFDLTSIDFNKAFNSLNTYQKLAPIGAYMDGSFNTSLVMDGKMGQDMMPVLDKLNAQGFLHTIAGEIKEFPTLSAVDEKLGLELFNGIQLKDTKNWFEIKNGLIEVKDFDIKYKEIELTIGGTHSLKQDVDYNIKADIPSSTYEDGLAGSAVDAGYALVNKQAGKLGLEIEKAERINLGISLSGKSTSPKVDVKLLGTDGKSDNKEIAEQLRDELENELDNKTDELKETVKEEADKLKDKAKNEVDKKKEELENKLKSEADKRKEEAAEEAERILKEKLEKARLDSILRERNKKAEEEIKKKLEEFNPLKRKKKGN
jgi:uncharacterized protein involved in outer membrane biogenesis